MSFRTRDFKSPASAIPPPARDAVIVPLWRSLVKRAGLLGLPAVVMHRNVLLCAPDAFAVKSGPYKTCKDSDAHQLARFTPQT